MDLINLKTTIDNNIDFDKSFKNEKDFCEWIRKNYKLLGFSEICEDNKDSTPDFVFSINGTKIRTEIETKSSNFILHKHDKNNIDLILCLKKDKEIYDIDIIEIKNFEFIDPTKILINLTDYHIEELDKLVKMGVYQHKAEAIRDAIRKLIEGRL